MKIFVKFLKYNIVTSLYYNYLIKKKCKKIKDSSFIISSFPKSGNTYVRLVLQDYLYNRTDLDLIDLDIPYIGKNNYKKCNLLKTHDLPNKHMKNGVFIHRDPKESTNSLFRSASRRGLNLNFLIFTILLNLGVLHFYSSPVNHLKKWLKHSKKNNFYVISYDELMNDSLRSFIKIIDHFGYDLKIEKLETSLNNCSIENVSHLELKSKTIQSQLKQKGFITGVSKIVNNESNIILNKQSKKYKKIT